MLYMYKSPSGNFHQFLRLFEKILMSVYRPKTEFVKCGDVNIDYLQIGTGNNNYRNYWVHMTRNIHRISPKDSKIASAQPLIIFL